MSPAPARLLLARHGETPYNAEARFQGHRPVLLNARGREQAAALAVEAERHRPVVLHASPLLRARQTAEIVGAHLGLEPRFDDRLAETDTGDWTDRTYAEVAAERPDLFHAWAEGDPTDFRFPGGESLVEQQARVVEALAEIRAAGVSPALVVCHRGSMRLALLHERGEPLARFPQTTIANGALVEL